MRPFLKKYAVHLLLVFSPFVVGAPLWLGERIFTFRDFFNQYWAFSFFSRHWMRQGIVPFWNPHIYGGTAFFANFQSCLFYPPNFFVYFLPQPMGFQFAILLHYSLAALGMFLLAKKLDLSAPASLLAAITFALGAAMVTTADTLTAFQAITWMPWVMASAFDFFSDKPQFRRAAAVAIALALQILAAEPQIFLITLGASCFLHVKITRKHAVLLPVIVVLTFAMTAFQLLPFLYEMRQSIRAAGFDRAFLGFWSLHPLELLGTIFPWVFGGLRHKWFGQEWLRGHFIGMIAIFLLAFLPWRKSQARRFLLGAGIFFLLAIAEFLPGLPWVLSKIPVLSQGRFPAKFFIGSLFLLSLLSAMGLDALEKATKKSRSNWAFALLGVAVLGLAATFFLPALGDFFLKHLPRFTFAAELNPFLNQTPVLRMITLGVLALTLALVVWITQNQHRNIKQVIALLCCFELLIYLPLFSQTGPKALLTETPHVLESTKPLPARIFWSSPTDAGGRWLHNRGEHTDILTFLLAKEVYAPTFNSIYGLDSANGYQGLPPQVSAAWEKEIAALIANHDVRLTQGLAEGGVDFLTSFERIEHPGLHLISPRPVFLYELTPRPLPCVIQQQGYADTACHFAFPSPNQIELTWPTDMPHPHIATLKINQRYDARWQATMTKDHTGSTQTRPLLPGPRFLSMAVDILPTDTGPLTLQFMEVGWPALGYLALTAWLVAIAEILRRQRR